MKLAYCTTCDPAEVVAVGAFSEKPAPSHRVNGKVHKCEIVEVPDLLMEPGEEAGAYLVRVGEKFSDKMK